MEYKKYNCNSYNIYTIKTDKFKTVRMEIVFRRNVIKEELPKFTFLVELLTDTCKEYPTRREMAISLEELYKSIFYGVTSKVGNMLTTNFILEFIDPIYINEKDYLDKVLAFPFKALNKPNIINKEFNIDDFNVVKRRMIDEIKSINDNSSKIAITDALKEMDDSSPSSFSVLGTLEDLDYITPMNLYDTYDLLLNHSLCDIFIVGNLNMDECVKIIKSNFKNRVIKSQNVTLKVNNKLRKKVLEKKNTKNFLQSNLVMIYNIKELTDLERNITFHVFNNILGGGLTSILYKNLRNDNSLCYSVRSMYLKQDNLLVINTLLDKSNVMKAKKLINKSINEVVKGKFSNTLLEDTKKTLIMSLQNALDNNNSILNNYEFNIFDNLPHLEDRIDMFNKVTYEDVINCAKKIKLNTIYVQEGDLDD